MTLFYCFYKEMHQSALVVSVLCVGKFREIRNVKTHGLLILGSSIHDISHQQDQFKNLSKFSGSPNFLTSLSSGNNVWLAVLNKFRIVKLELERFESWDKSLDISETYGKLFSFCQIIKLTAELLKFV